MNINKIYTKSPFFEMATLKDGTSSKKPKMSWQKDDRSRLDLDKLESLVGVGFAAPKGYIVVDADRDHAVDNVEKIIKLMGLKVFSYSTTRGKHYVFKLPKGEFFEEKIGSTNGGTIFVKENKPSEIDVKGNGKGYFVIKKDGKWRVKPQEILDAFENAPECPLSLLLPNSRKIKIRLEDYVEGPRDDTVFRWLPIIRASLKYTKKQFIQFAVELSRLANDKETIQETKEWAEVKWESSVSMGDVTDFTGSSGLFWLKAFKSTGYKLKDDDGEKITLWKQTDILEYTIVADKIIEDAKLQYSFEDKQIWGMDSGQFQPIKQFDLFVKKWCIKEVGNVEPVVFSKLKNYLEGSIPVKTFTKNNHMVTFENTNYDILENKEVELRENEMNQNIIPHRLISKKDFNTLYKEEAEFLNKIFDGWTMGQNKIKQELLELIGLSMTKDMSLGFAYFLLGIGANGKSMFLDWLIDILGKENVSTEDLKEISGDRFSSTELYAKLANISTDISTAYIEDASLFKKLTTGDMISAQDKGQKKFKFRPYATQIFGTNAIPNMRDSGDSNGVSRRIRIITFNADFTNTKDTAKQKAEMINKLHSERVIEAAIYMALKSVGKAFRTEFSVSKQAKIAIKNHIRNTNHMYDFINESGVNHNEVIVKAHKRYVDWSKKYKYQALGYQQFTAKYINAGRALGIEIEKIMLPGVKDETRHRFHINE